MLFLILETNIIQILTSDDNSIANAQILFFTLWLTDRIWSSRNI